MFYTLKMAYYYRRAICEASQMHAVSHKAIPFESLKHQGIKALVFDFDGVLSSHGKPLPDAAGITCLNAALKHFDNLYILSNKPTKARQDYFKHHYPDITFINALRKKPYPDGLLAIASHAKQPPAALCLIDDRLLTGVLASIIAGTKIIYIKDPLIDYTAHPCMEWLFQSVRIIERALFGKNS